MARVRINKQSWPEPQLHSQQQRLPSAANHKPQEDQSQLKVTTASRSTITITATAIKAQAFHFEKQCPTELIFASLVIERINLLRYAFHSLRLAKDLLIENF